MNAQHILAKICDFKNWDDFYIHQKQNKKIGALKLNCYKVGVWIPILLILQNVSCCMSYLQTLSMMTIQMMID